MDMRIPPERLNESIKAFAHEAIEARQLMRRLRDLLPNRLRAIHRRHGASARRGGRAERLALVDKQYISHLEELMNISSNAVHARIEYETHMMLLQARQSLRAFNKP